MKIKFVSPHLAASCQLVLGDKSAILIDAALPFCANETVENIIQQLNGRKLDAIVLSHSHYDHICGLPWIRKAFPDTPIYAHEYLFSTLNRPTALAKIKEMCQEAAAQFYKGEADPINFNYKNENLMPTHQVYDGMQIPFDNGFATIILTPGHTNDSISIDFSSEKVCWLCETIGMPKLDGRIQPCFLTSYLNCMETIEKISALGERIFFFPHIVESLSQQASLEYIEKAKKENTETKDIILSLLKKHDNIDDVFKEYKDIFWIEKEKEVWPLNAFTINSYATIACIAKEFS